MNGHGHVTPNSDGSKARCGGPTLCRVCAAEVGSKGTGKGARVLVCGSRDYTDRDAIWIALDTLHATHGISVIIEGEAQGADTLAAQWWQVLGAAEGVLIERYPADWLRYGRAAEPIRNNQMLREGRPDIVLAFPSCPLSQSRGTTNMVEQARKAGVRVVVHGTDDIGVVASQDDRPVTGASFLDPMNKDAVTVVAKAIRDAHAVVSTWYTAPGIPAEMYALAALDTIREHLDV